MGRRGFGLLAVLLLLGISSGQSDHDGLLDAFDVSYLGHKLTVILNGDRFSAREISENFCLEHNLDSTHHRSLRELVENAAVKHLGEGRLNLFWHGEDDEGEQPDLATQAVVDGICRDFPGLHSLPYEYLLRRKTPRKIIDTFPFFNELDILEIRLRELSGVVAKFVLVESAQTHSGKPKDLLFEQNRERFFELGEEIVHVVLEKLPDTEDHWIRERSQRDGIHDGLELAGVEPDDLVIISDADEIPRRSTLRALSWCEGYRSPLHLRSAFYYYSFRHRWVIPPSEVFQWSQPRAILRSQLEPPRLGVNHVRYDQGEGNMEVVTDASWHLSFWGGEKRILDKIEAYAHQENNIQEYKDADHIRKTISSGGDLFKRASPHGTLQANNEPYDLPSPVLEDLRAGNGQAWIEYLPAHFDLPVYLSEGMPSRVSKSDL